MRELRDNETVASALKRLAHKPDWNDYQAETAGPYASRKNSILSLVSVSDVVFFTNFWCGNN